MMLILDNRDSFVFNIARYFEELGQACEVWPSHEVSLSDIDAANPDGIVLSPGPCTPQEAGICLDVLDALSGQYPILGVCLGHQCIGEAFGAEIIRAGQPKYGQTSPITHNGRGLFSGLETPLEMGLYHSLGVKETTRSKAALEVTARGPDGEVMALAHKQYTIWGVQFHPESILSEKGYAIFANFLQLAGLEAGSVEGLTA